MRYVAWYEAIKFCEWLTDKWHKAGVLPAKRKIQLPSEAEWEKAARGGHTIPVALIIKSIGEIILKPTPETEVRENQGPKRDYPWGDNPDADYANYSDTEIKTTSTVGCFPKGASRYGCEEMSGNVWEWTRSLYRDYPYVPNDGRENLEASEYTPRELRGGSFRRSSRFVRCSYRSWGGPYGGSGYGGFRVVASPFRG